MWTVSRSDGDEPRVLGVFASLDQACVYLDQQVTADAAWWGLGGRWAARSGGSQRVAYTVTQPSPRERQALLRKLVARRRWWLRCGHCGAEWTAGAQDVLAGDTWLSCPQCHGRQPACSLAPAGIDPAGR